MEEFRLLDALRKKGIVITEEQEKEFIQITKTQLEYIPKIGVFGKTGAGKSSLCNALYGEECCDVSDVEACTSKKQEVNTGGVILVDCPGIAESKEKDQQYMNLYYNLIPDLDAIFWVLKGDDRAYQPDLDFYNSIKNRISPKTPLFFVINQVDKIEPFKKKDGGWDEDKAEPGPVQFQNIQRRVGYVATTFDYVKSKVIPVSASEGYNLITLVHELLHSLPKEKVINTAFTLKEELREDKTTDDVVKEKTAKTWMENLEKSGIETPGDLLWEAVEDVLTGKPFQAVYHAGKAAWKKLKSFF